jgi:hypothetical protein
MAIEWRCSNKNANICKKIQIPDNNNSLLHVSITTFPKGPTFLDWYNGEVEDPSWGVFFLKLLKICLFLVI